MALTQPPRKRTRVWPTTVVGVLALLTALLALPLTLARRAEGYVYWTNHDTDTIGRANLDGTNADQSFITGAWRPGRHRGRRRARLLGKRRGNDRPRQPRRHRADQGFISPGAGTPQGVAVDADHVYWADIDPRTRSAAPTSTAPDVNQSFISGASDPRRRRGRRHPHLLGELRHERDRARQPRRHRRSTRASSATPARQRFAANGRGGRRRPRLLGGPVRPRIGRANLDGSGVNPSFITGDPAPRRGSRSTAATSTGRTSPRHDRARQPRRHRRQPELHRRAAPIQRRGRLGQPGAAPRDHRAAAESEGLCRRSRPDPACASEPNPDQGRPLQGRQGPLPSASRPAASARRASS